METIKYLTILMIFAGILNSCGDPVESDKNIIKKILARDYIQFANEETTWIYSKTIDIPGDSTDLYNTPDTNIIFIRQILAAEKELEASLFYYDYEFKIRLQQDTLYIEPDPLDYIFENYPQFDNFQPKNLEFPVPFSKGKKWLIQNVEYEVIDEEYEISVHAGQFKTAVIKISNQLNDLFRFEEYFYIDPETGIVRIECEFLHNGERKYYLGLDLYETIIN